MGDLRKVETLCSTVAVLSLGIVLFGLILPKVWHREAPTAFAQWIAPAIPACLLTLLCLSCAEALRLRRFVIHAIGFAAAGVIVATAELESGWSFVMAGTFVASWGFFMLTRFLREFPRLPVEPSEDQP